MKCLDAQLSPHLAPWITKQLGIEVYSLEYLELDTAEDEEIFDAAREAGAVIMTKDEDFVGLFRRLGAPPQLVWISCGNTSNAYLRGVPRATLKDALAVLAAGDTLTKCINSSHPLQQLIKC